MDPNREMGEFDQPWKAPRELMRSAPREVRLTKAGIAINVLAVAFLIGAAALAVGLGSKASRESAERRMLDSQGVPADAVVTRLWHRTDKEKTPMVAYQFTYNGQIYRHSTGAPQRVWKSLTEGATVKIRLVPDHPENNTPVDWQGDGPMPRFVPFVVGLPFLFGSLAMFWRLRFEKRLLSEGKTTMGIVRKSRRAQHGKNVFQYDFKVPGGRILSRRSAPTSKVLAPGSLVTVLYDPDKPSRSALHPLELVRIDDMS